MTLLLLLAVLPPVLPGCGIIGDCDIEWILLDECHRPTDPVEHPFDREEIRQILEEKRLRESVTIEIVEAEGHHLVVKATNGYERPLTALSIELVYGDQVEVRVMKAQQLSVDASHDFVYQLDVNIEDLETLPHVNVLHVEAQRE